MRLLAISIPLLLLASTGCALDPDAPTAVASSPTTATDVPTLTFGPDWSVSQTGTLVAGEPAHIHYDVDRLPDCRATYNGLPAWAIAAYFDADGGPGQSANVTSGDATFVVPAGHDLAMWFHASDEHGCEQWDSVYGANYHFAIVSPPTVHFRAQGYAVEIDGTPRAGDDVMIDYELARLPSCRQDYNGYQTWDVVAHWRFDGGPVSDGSVTAVQGTGERTAAPLLVHAPDGARDLELWFENTDRTGCEAWDSDYGRNFHIALQ